MHHLGVLRSLAEGVILLRSRSLNMGLLEGLLSLLGILLCLLSNSLSVLSLLLSYNLGSSVLTLNSLFGGLSFSSELSSNLLGNGGSLGLLLLGLSLSLSFSGMRFGDSNGGLIFGGLNGSRCLLGSGSGLDAHLGNGLGGFDLSGSHLLGVRNLLQGVLGGLVHLRFSLSNDFLHSLTGFSGLGSGMHCVVNGFLGSGLNFGNGGFLGSLGRLDLDLSHGFDSMDGLDGVLKSVLEGSDLLLSNVSSLLSLGSGTL